MKKWTALGRSERAVWGLCQGSGKDPYQSRVDLSEPAFKCSCPSRKFPCKHGLGLMLLYARDAAAIPEAAEPGWVADWLVTRKEKAEKKSEPKAATPVDLEAQAKRRAVRDERVKDGIEECAGWLKDLMRGGLAKAQTESSAFWERVAARMLDAQAPGLATMVRRLRASVSAGEGWQTRALHEIGRLHLLLQAGAKLDALPPGLSTDARTALGFTQSKEDALNNPSGCVTDRWLVTGQIIEEEDQLRVRRTWLIGRTTRRRALLLDFAAAAQPFAPAAMAGTEFDGEIAFFPSSAPLRALIKTSGALTGTGALGACADKHWDAALGTYSAALAANPWTLRWPVVIADAVMATRDVSAAESWAVTDARGRSLPVRPGLATLWKLVAITGGVPATISGEWDGEYFTPLSVLDERGTFEDVAPRWAA